MTIATADLYDERGEELQSLPLQLTSFGGAAAFDGRIRTVRCHEDNALLKSVLSTPGDGAVLVVDGGGSLGRALLGDVIAQLAVDNGWAGAVIHGAVRDRVALAAIPLGIKALGSNPRKSTKTGAGEADAVVAFGGAVFRPGAHLWADADGVLVER
jgi:regulator of ribonuclease activity A